MGTLTKRAESMGVRVKEMRSEISTAAATVRPNCLRKRPTMPPVVAIGPNTATRVKVVAVTARPISAVAREAAVRRSSPCSTWR